jgi:hypothetical protein
VAQVQGFVSLVGDRAAFLQEPVFGAWAPNGPQARPLRHLDGDSLPGPSSKSAWLYPLSPQRNMWTICVEGVETQTLAGWILR